MIVTTHKKYYRLLIETGSNQGSKCASKGMVSRLITNRRYDATNSCYDTCTPNVIGSYFNALLMLFRSDVTEIR